MIRPRLPLRVGDDSGVSVIEVLIGSTLFFVLLAAMLSSLDSATRHERGLQSRDEALLELRGAMTRVAKDVRQAVTIAESPDSDHSRLEFSTLVSGVEKAIVYEVEGGEFRRSIDGGSPISLATGIAPTVDPAFCYTFDSVAKTCVDGGAVPTSPTIIRVTLALSPDAFSGGPITLATDVQLRNLRP